MIHSDNGILFSAFKELSSHEKTWGKLKCILLSERSQSEKATYCMIPTIWPSGKGKKTIETIKRTVVAEVSWGGNKGYLGRL